MTWIIVSLVLGLIALMALTLRNVLVAHDANVVLLKHIIEIFAHQHTITHDLQDTADIIRRTTDATHLRLLDQERAEELYAPSTESNDQSLFEVVEALMKDLEDAKTQGQYAPRPEGSVQPVFDTVDTQVKDLETSKAQVPAVDPAAWGGPQQAVPEDPWKNAR